MMMIFIVQKHTFYIMNWYFKDNQFQLIGNLLYFQICESLQFDDRFSLSLFCVVVSVTVILMSLFLMLMLLLTYLFPFGNGMECQ